MLLPWNEYVKRKDNIGLPILKIKEKFLNEQKNFEWNLFQYFSSAPPSGGGTVSSSEPLPLRLLFDDIVNAPVGNANIVSDWNTFFDLPTNGTAFSSVTVVGNEVQLFGGAGITFKDYLFQNFPYLIEIDDTAECIIACGINSFEYCDGLISINLPEMITAGNSCFFGCVSLASINFTNLQTAGAACFWDCSSLVTPEFLSLTTIGNSAFSGCYRITNLKIPACTALGTTTGNNGVFTNITFKTITLTVPSALMTCNGGNPDGDIVSLQANNTVTVIQI